VALSTNLKQKLIFMMASIFMTAGRLHEALEELQVTLIMKLVKEWM
jgi:hypothetical protein